MPDASCPNCAKLAADLDAERDHAAALICEAGLRENVVAHKDEIKALREKYDESIKASDSFVKQLEAAEATIERYRGALIWLTAPRSPKEVLDHVKAALAPADLDAAEGAAYERGRRDIMDHRSTEIAALRAKLKEEHQRANMAHEARLAAEAKLKEAEENRDDWKAAADSRVPWIARAEAAEAREKGMRELLVEAVDLVSRLALCDDSLRGHVYTDDAGPWLMVARAALAPEKEKP